jgi:GNAT superfamily N-acetyltransferase
VRPSDVVLRPATPADAVAVAPFHLRCWQDAYTGLVPQTFLDALTRQDRVRRWGERLRTAGDVTTLATAGAGGPVVGLAAVTTQTAPAAAPLVELRSLYVGATWWGQGLGRRLLDAALAGRPAQLWVFEGNARARAFYRTTGWRLTGDRQIDPGTGLWELRLIRN